MKLNRKFKFIQDDRGFTLAELLVASVISAVVLSIAYSLTNVVMKSNKSDGVNMKLGAKIDNALDFVVDEVNSSKRIITSQSSIKASCMPSGQFLIGLEVPDQAKDTSSYKNMGAGAWKKVDCPIVYALRPDNSYKGKGRAWELWRNGPNINEKGYYVPSNFGESLISNAIADRPLDSMPCDKTNGWTEAGRNGVIICVDKRQKAAEIGISALSVRDPNRSSGLTKSSGGYTRIQDDSLIGDMGAAYFPGLGKGNACIDPQKCCLFGSKANCASDDVTYFIDVSGSMGWGRIGNPPKTYMEAAKSTLIESIKNLSDGTKLNVVAFNHYPRYLWPGGPQELNSSTRFQAISFVSKLRAGGGTNPWSGLEKTIKNKNVKEIFVMSDGYTHTSGYCGGKNQKYSECFKKYNENNRAGDPVKINSVSIGMNFCSERGGWMGDLATKNGGKCTVVR